MPPVTPTTPPPTLAPGILVYYYVHFVNRLPIHCIELSLWEPGLPSPYTLLASAILILHYQIRIKS